MPRTVAQKMGVREGTRAHLVDAPASVVAVLQLPALDLVEQPVGSFGYLHLFVRRQDDLAASLPRLVPHLEARGMLWVSWPKGRGLGTDLTIREVIRICYDHSLVESTALSVDRTWSAIKLTHPRPGKVYANSYGTLPGADADRSGP